MSDLDRDLWEVVRVAMTGGDVELEVLAEFHHVISDANVVQAVL